MQNDIVRRPVVRPPARQASMEDNNQQRVSSSPAVQPAESPVQDQPQADLPPAPQPPEIDPTAGQAPDESANPPAENPQPEDTSQPDTNEKKHGHGLVIAFALVVFIGLAFAAVYLEISSQKTQEQPVLPEAQQSISSPENVNSSIGL